MKRALPPLVVLLAQAISFTFSLNAAINNISPGQTITGQAITVPKQTNYYSFTAVSNEAVTILMSRTGAAGNEPYFELYGPNGALLTTPDNRDGTIAFLDAFQLTQTGTYLIGCRAAVVNDTSTTDITTLTLHDALPTYAAINNISPGQTITGQAITVPTQTNYYSFTAVSNEAVTILMSRTGAAGN